MYNLQKIESIDLYKKINAIVPLKKVGIYLYRGYCPFHKEKDPSFTINIKKNFWKCYGCNKNGDWISFVQYYYKFSSRKKAMQYLCKDEKGSISTNSNNINYINILKLKINLLIKKLFKNKKISEKIIFQIEEKKEGMNETQLRKLYKKLNSL